MKLQRELDLVEQLLRQRRPSTQDIYQRVCWERGFLTGFLASIAQSSPEVKRLINSKINQRR